MPLKEALQWYPMRVTYNRELKIKQRLDALRIENFVPMQWKLCDTPGGPRRKLVPAIHNLIFVHSTQELLTALKRQDTELEPLRYITRRQLANPERHEILHVPDREMENFMRVARVEDERVMHLDYNSFLGKEGRRVRVREGIFAGVEGTVKRIRKNKHVVVQIEGVAAVAITYVPASYLEEIT